VQRHQLSHHLKSDVAEFAAASCLVVAVGAFPCRAGASQGGAGVGDGPSHRRVGRQDGAAEEAVPPFRDGAAGASHREGHLGAGDASYAAGASQDGRAEAC